MPNACVDLTMHDCMILDIERTYLALTQQLLLQKLLLLLLLLGMCLLLLLRRMRLLLLTDGRGLRGLLCTCVAQALQLLVMSLRQSAHIERREAAQDARVDSLKHQISALTL